MAQNGGSVGAAGWVEGGYSVPTNMNTMDAQSMPSDKAEAARQKAREILAASKKGEPGDADKLMGKNESVGMGPLGWFKSKTSGSKKDKEEKKKEKKQKDTVIR